MKLVFLVSLLVAVVTASIIPKPGFPEDNTHVGRGRIINGQTAYVGEAPYIVTLSKEYYGKHFCAGSIIGDRWILTAAHCMMTDQIYVTAGINDRTSRTEGQTIRVERIFKHDGYTSGIAPFDIALMRLESPLHFNSRVQAVELPSDSVQQTGEAILYGWGRDSRNIAPELLQTVRTDLITYSDCLSRGPWPWKLHPTNICTSSRNQNISSCKGDSGGPLVQKSNDKTVLVGVVSWGYLPCGEGNYPSMYTHTGSYLDWIKQRLY